MEGFSVINLQQFHYYQESFGYIAQLNFPEKLTFHPKHLKKRLNPLILVMMI